MLRLGGRIHDISKETSDTLYSKLIYFRRERECVDKWRHCHVDSSDIRHEMETRMCLNGRDRKYIYEKDKTNGAIVLQWYNVAAMMMDHAQERKKERKASYISDVMLL